MHQRWIPLSLLASSVSAFYPHVKALSGSDVHDRTSVPVRTPAETRDDAAGKITLDIKKIATKRDNDFSVLLSSTPSASNAIAIDQDGSDYSYFSALDFGSKSTSMYMLIDTGSANTWVMGSDCTSTACKSHNTFGSSDSTSLVTTDTTWDIAYGTGEVTGVVASDTVAFGEYSLNLTFGLATNTSSDFDNYPMDGILGLGPSTTSDLDAPTLMKALEDQASLSSNILGVHLNRATDGTKDGELTIGGVDESKYSGDLNYLSIVATDSWEVSVDDCIVAGTACGLTDKAAIIDTGTSYILMPPADAATLHALIPGSANDSGSYTVPCDTTTVVQVSLNDVKYSISHKDYVGSSSGSACSSNIIAHAAFGANVWILGDVFLKNVYTVFDFDKNRIGFGTGNETSTSTSSSSSATASSSSKSSSATATSTGTSSAETTTSSASSGSKDGSSTSTAGASSTSSSATSDAVMAPLPLAMLMPVAFASALMMM